VEEVCVCITVLLYGVEMCVRASVCLTVGGF